MAVTVLESLLEPAFDMAERFVQACQNKLEKGIIGPFALQSIITAGPPKKELEVIDVSPRMPGSPGIGATPYSSYHYGRAVSVGERIAMEVASAIEQGALHTVLS